jgi:hypothetical protein
MTAYRDAISIYRETGDQYREGITRENLDRALQSAPGTGQRTARTLGRLPGSTWPGGFTISPLRPCVPD